MNPLPAVLPNSTRRRHASAKRSKVKTVRGSADRHFIFAIRDERRKRKDCHSLFRDSRFDREIRIDGNFNKNHKLNRVREERYCVVATRSTRLFFRLARSFNRLLSGIGV